MIDAEGVSFDHAAGRALHRVGFVVRSGAVVALVGPRGAGKTTLLRCLAALDRPTEGLLTVLGLDTRREPRQVHAAIGHVPDRYGLYEALSVERCLTYAARSHGVAAERAQEAVANAACRLSLTDRLEDLAGTLSRPWRHRLALAQSVVHSPRVLLLDEPAAGLDSEMKALVSQLIASLAADGVTIMVATPTLSEVESDCTDVLRLNGGQVVGDGVVRLQPGGGA